MIAMTRKYAFALRELLILSGDLRGIYPASRPAFEVDKARREMSETVFREIGKSCMRIPEDAYDRMASLRGFATYHNCSSLMFGSHGRYFETSELGRLCTEVSAELERLERSGAGRI